MSNKVVVVVVISLIAVFVIGFLVGFFVDPKDKSSSSSSSSDERRTESGRFKQHKKLYDLLEAEKLREYLRIYSERPHLAGSEAQLEYGRKMKQEWESYGETFGKVEEFPYNVLLSYLEKGQTNVVSLFNKTGFVQNFTGLDETKQPTGNHTIIAPLLGYAKPTSARGKLIYANYGRAEDFKLLKEVYNLTNCNGTIVIMRFGKIYRGNKVEQAEKFGAAGAILYNDPEDYAPLGPDATYPDTWWLPPDGVQRGNLRKVKGDPLTPEVPAIEDIYRNTVDEVYMPGIPATPLPYGQAKELLKRLQGTEAPDDWQGGLNFKYKIGVNTKIDVYVEVEVNAKLVRKNVTNIIGTIVGQEEPDRWVLIGAHRDAWGFGAVDSVCGTAVLMELARALDILVKAGWRPRRTIKLCSWSAEEQGLIGSTEWVQEQSKIVRDRAVAYINIDALVRGNHSLEAKGSPLLKLLMYEESMEVSDPRNDGDSLYDWWQKSSASGSEYPKYKAMGSGSDFVPFYQFLGVPSIGYSYNFKDKGITFYPVYHTEHDTFEWMEKFVDPQFQIHLSMCKLSARLLLRLSDSDKLPLQVTDYSAALIKSMNSMNTSRLPSDTKFEHVIKAILEFNKTAHEFETRRKKFSSANDFVRLRMLNNQMMNLEKIFVNPYGLPGRPDQRNIVFAPSISNSYGSSSFPGITDLLVEPVDRTEVRKQINILYKSVLEAKRFLEPQE